MQNGSLATSQAMRSLHTRAAKLMVKDLPKCAACQFGQQTNRSKPGKVTQSVREREGILSADKTHPGDRVFIDHFVCSTRGRLFHGQGIRDPQGKTITKNSTPVQEAITKMGKRNALFELPWQWQALCSCTAPYTGLKSAIQLCGQWL